MNGEVSAVMKALIAGGIPAIRAYPEEAMQEPKQPMAAVSLAEADAEQVTVQVTVIAPAALGGPACEDGAIKAAKLLQSLGAVSVSGPCRYDDRCDLFSMEVFVTIGGEKAE